MSRTSDLITNVTQAIKDLRSADETPLGEQGDPFETQMDKYVDAVKERFDVIVNDTDDVIADIDTDELTVGTESPVTGYGAGVSVDNGNLVSGDVSDEHIRDVIAGTIVGRDGIDSEYDAPDGKIYIDATGTPPDGGGGGGGGTVTTVDNFESQSLGNYRNPGGFDFSSTAIEGSWSLRGTGNRALISTPGDGLPYYPSRGDTIKLDINLQDTTGAQVAFGYATQSVDTGMEVQLHFDLGEVYWVETINGTEQTATDRTAHNFSTNEWHTLTIDWDSSGGESVSYDGTTLNTSSTPRDSGGIYFRVVDCTALYDNVRVV